MVLVDGPWKAHIVKMKTTLSRMKMSLSKMKAEGDDEIWDVPTGGDVGMRLWILGGEVIDSVLT